MKFLCDYEIIDFHTHPFIDVSTNICAYRHHYDMDKENIIETMKSFGISKMCGGVIRNENKEAFVSPMEKIKENNRIALRLRDEYNGFYVPGFQVHPDFVGESIEEVEKMSALGVKLLGEIVPYHDGWNDYNHAGLHEILNAAAKHSMVVNFHNMSVETIDGMVSAHPDIIFVAAHPGEYHEVVRHIERMKKYENVYIDISGTGVFRWHCMKYIVDMVGSERVLFGTDYPTCNPGVYIGGLLAEPFSSTELRNIFSENAKRLLSL